MNAAFAIGRLCDLENGRNRLLSIPESDIMVIKDSLDVKYISKESYFSDIYTKFGIKIRIFRYN